MPNDHTPLTAGEFRDAIDTLMGIVATKEDLKTLREELPTREQITKLQNTTDAYTKKTERWRQEQVVLAAQHNKLKTTLISKGVVAEQELAV